VNDVVLTEGQWRQRRAAHERRVDAWIGPHRERRLRGEKHPVEDFLFEYYSHRPAQLRRWHPGAGVVLTGPAAREYQRWDGYRWRDPDRGPGPGGPDLTGPDATGPDGDDPAAGDRGAAGGGVVLDLAAVFRRRGETVRWVRELLAATAGRPAQFGCFGMHEWAMVYRQDASEVRHAAWPLRHPPERVAAIVAERGVRCSHFDAFRFFTPAARPLNLLQPTRQTQAAFEQGGCLHANMDLYKWAYKLAPLTPSELVADCFGLAREIRALDMRASPYDLAALGYPPVPIETPEGRAEYAAAQRDFADRAAVLRARLLGVCELALQPAA
jgi:hypothetical protein